MGMYYKHKATRSVKVPYSFCCEHCMKDSGPLTATITGTAELNSNFKKLSEQKSEKLNQDAHRNLVQKLKTARTDAEEKHLFSKEFNDECPHCHQPQSWALAAMKKDKFSTPIIIVIIGAIFGLGTYFFTDVKNLKVSVGIFVVALVAAVVVFVWNMIKIGIKTKKTSTSMQCNLPTIEWSAVQNFLNE